MRFTTTLDRDGRDAGVDLLPADVRAQVGRFRRSPGPTGVLLLHGVPVGEVPATPPSPTAPTSKDDVSELAILAIAEELGESVGYLPEHGGTLVQNLVPTREGADRQISTSSRATLDFHTETAFHPHRPHHLVLMCLRGDPTAITTYCSVDMVLPHLDDGTATVLSEPRFRCGVDESFTAGARVPARPAAPVLWRDRHGGACMTFDADLMSGTDGPARSALDSLRQVVADRHTGVVLDVGDVLVIDNTRTVHGRTPYRPRFDGTDRWLQRTFVVDDLGTSATERAGRVITTRFL